MKDHNNTCRSPIECMSYIRCSLGHVHVYAAAIKR